MKRKNRFKLKSIFFIILIILLLVSSKVYSNNKLKKYVSENYKEELEVDEKDKEIGELKSSLEYDKNSIILENYPDFDNKDINKLIKSTIQEETLVFEEQVGKEKHKDFEDIPVLAIDYRSTAFTDNIASVLFKIKTNIPAEKLEDKKFKTLNFNLQDGEVLKMEDLIIEEGYDFLFDMVKKQNSSQIDEKLLASLEEDKNSFSQFILAKDKLEILLDSEGELISTTIAYEDFENYTKVDLNSLEPLPKEIVEEKIEKANFSGPIRNGLDPKKPMIALTFDDGPYDQTTRPIVDMLEEYDSAATFFILGEKVEANKELIKDAADKGNEIANHSLNHKLLTAISGAELDEQIDETQALIADVIGYEPYLLRPTYGAINENMENNIDLPFILWSIDTLDWEHRNPDLTVSKVLGSVKDGDIILMHDIYPTTTEASLRLIPKLIDEGYQLVTISELYAYKGIELQPGQAYTDANSN